MCSGAGQVAYFGPVELWTGHGPVLLGRFDEAVVDLQTAAEACAANGAVGFLVEAQYELASALARRRHPGDVAWARSLLKTISPQASVLGMSVIKARRTPASKSSEQPGPSLGASGRWPGLSPPERRTGRSRSELWLSERTAQNHVQHVLTKLGLSNRSQIVAWVAHQE